MSANLYFVCFILIINSIYVTADYFINLSCNDPVIQGAILSCTAKLRENGGIPEGIFKYHWTDDAIERHTWEITTNKTEVTWNITYPVSDYPMGTYDIQVIVEKCYLWNAICMVVTSKRLEVNITSTLNGHMKLKQKTDVVQTNYIATKLPITHEISLNQPDMDFLKKNATNIVTYWFIDCQYFGSSQNYSFNYEYNKTNVHHVVEGLVVAGFEPITTPAPTTTSTTTTTPKTTTSTTTKPTTSTTTPKPTTTTPKMTTTTTSVTTSTTTIRAETTTLSTEIPLFHHPSLLTRRKRDIQNVNDTVNNSTELKNNTIVESKNISTHIPYPYVCGWNKNFTNSAPDPKKVYGYFKREFITNDPITNITVTGNNWLKKGDEVHLKVKCDGSPPFKYCLNYYYNATTNITCIPEIPLDDSCEFDLLHYYSEPTEHNILVIIQNYVTTYKSPMTVTVYKVETHPQLSVIVVPVSFSLVAVVLIVFGIAYYIQNQRRFTIEVANFDFSQQYTDMEYKTFKERLKDSISNAFTRPHSETPEPSMWSGNRQYGSMT